MFCKKQSGDRRSTACLTNGQLQLQRLKCQEKKHVKAQHPAQGRLREYVAAAESGCNLALAGQSFSSHPALSR